MSSNDLKISSDRYEDCLGDGVAWSVDLEERDDHEGFDLKLEFYDRTDGMFTTNINIWGVSSDGMKAYIKALKRFKHI